MKITEEWIENKVDDLDADGMLSTMDALREGYRKGAWDVVDEIDNEKHIIESLNKMCIESLDPENFQKWEEVKERLKLNRKALKS